jgi:hypothetical protein
MSINLDLLIEELTVLRKKVCASIPANLIQIMELIRDGRCCLVRLIIGQYPIAGDPSRNVR